MRKEYFLRSYLFFLLFSTCFNFNLLSVRIVNKDTTSNIKLYSVQ